MSDARSRAVRYFCQAIMQVTPAITHEGLLTKDIFPYECSSHLLLTGRVGCTKFLGVTAEPWSLILTTQYPIDSLKIDDGTVKEVKRDMEICLDYMQKYKRLEWKPYRVLIRALRQPFYLRDEYYGESGDEVYADKYHIYIKMKSIVTHITLSS